MQYGWLADEKLCWTAAGVTEYNPCKKFTSTYIVRYQMKM